MNIKVTIDTSDFDMNVAGVDDIIQQELESGAHRIERQAKIDCPVDTGNLRRSITTDIGSLEVDIGSSCDYAGYVHDGTYKMEARPFLESAAEMEIDEIGDRIADAISRLL